jgi:hypothetical protein
LKKEREKSLETQVAANFSCCGKVIIVNTLNIEDSLEGVTNFWAWKERVIFLLEENDLKKYVEGVVSSPIDPLESTAHKKKDVKVKRVLLKSIKDHLIPHIVEKKYSKEMYDSLVSLHQNMNTGRMLHMKHQLQVVNISSEDRVVNLLCRGSMHERWC